MTSLKTSQFRECILHKFSQFFKAYLNYLTCTKACDLLIKPKNGANKVSIRLTSKAKFQRIKHFHLKLAHIFALNVRLINRQPQKAYTGINNQAKCLTREYFFRAACSMLNTHIGETCGAINEPHARTNAFAYKIFRLGSPPVRFIQITYCT